MKKNFYLAIVGVGGLTALGTAIGHSIFGTLAGFGAGCILTVLYFIDD